MTDQQTDRHGDWILTFTGKAFWPMDPRPEDVDVRDICHALSLETRYGGHCAYHYSVAQHTVLLHDYIVQLGQYRTGFLKYVILHDVSEAYIKDIPRPLKAFLPDYNKIESKINGVLFDMFVVRIREFEGLEFKDFDTRISRDEIEALFQVEPQWKIEPLGIKIERWLPEQAEDALLELFKLYWPEMCP